MVDAAPLEQRAGVLTVTDGGVFNDNVPEPFPEHPPSFVIITEYVPATVALKLAAFPGLVAPPGTVHT